MDSWVIVQTFINPQEAYMAKAFLESAGIETRMQDELTVRTGIHAQAIGGVKLLVRHECWQEALKVLEEGFSLIPAGLEDGVIREVCFEGGCSGNLQGISMLVRGMKVEEVIERLEGIQCGSKRTSCPDQLVKALKEIERC